jgi:hypothetical protein
VSTPLEVIREDQALGAAWRRCEAALPEGGYMRVTRYSDGFYGAAVSEYFTGPTPAAALEALAAALEKRGAGE